MKCVPTIKLNGKLFEIHKAVDETASADEILKAFHDEYSEAINDILDRGNLSLVEIQDASLLSKMVGNSSLGDVSSFISGLGDEYRPVISGISDVISRISSYGLNPKVLWLDTTSGDIKLNGASIPKINYGVNDLLVFKSNNLGEINTTLNKYFYQTVIGNNALNRDRLLRIVRLMSIGTNLNITQENLFDIIFNDQKFNKLLDEGLNRTMLFKTMNNIVHGEKTTETSRPYLVEDKDNIKSAKVVYMDKSLFHPSDEFVSLDTELKRLGLVQLLQALRVIRDNPQVMPKSKKVLNDNKFGTRKRQNVIGSDAVEAIANGEKTSITATRDRLKDLRKGDVILINSDGKTAFVRLNDDPHQLVTGRLMPVNLPVWLKPGTFDPTIELVGRVPDGTPMDLPVKLTGALPFLEPKSKDVEVEYWSKPWRDGQGNNRTMRIFLKGNKQKGYFEVVKDNEAGYYSVHFKPANGKNIFTEAEKQLLFQSVADVLPDGAKISTYGEVTRGGIHGINRFNKFGLVKTDEVRQLQRVADKGAIIPDAVTWALQEGSTDAYFDKYVKPALLSGEIYQATFDYVDPVAIQTRRVKRSSLAEQSKVRVTLRGKELEYTVTSGRIFNSKGEEVYKSESADRNRIIANWNYANGRAVIVDGKYVVDNQDNIISLDNGKRPKLTEEEKKSVLLQAGAEFQKLGIDLSSYFIYGDVRSQWTQEINHNSGRISEAPEYAVLPEERKQEVDNELITTADHLGRPLPKDEDGKSWFRQLIILADQASGIIAISDLGRDGNVVDKNAWAILRAIDSNKSVIVFSNGLWYKYNYSTEMFDPVGNSLPAIKNGDAVLSKNVISGDEINAILTVIKNTRAEIARNTSGGQKERLQQAFGEIYNIALDEGKILVTTDPEMLKHDDVLHFDRMFFNSELYNDFKEDDRATMTVKTSDQLLQQPAKVTISSSDGRKIFTIDDTEQAFKGLVKDLLLKRQLNILLTTSIPTTSIVIPGRNEVSTSLRSLMELIEQSTHGAIRISYGTGKGLPVVKYTNDRARVPASRARRTIVNPTALELRTWLIKNGYEAIRVETDAIQTGTLSEDASKSLLGVFSDTRPLTDALLNEQAQQQFQNKVWTGDETKYGIMDIRYTENGKKGLTANNLTITIDKAKLRAEYEREKEKPSTFEEYVSLKLLTLNIMKRDGINRERATEMAKDELKRFMADKNINLEAVEKDADEIAKQLFSGRAKNKLLIDLKYIDELLNDDNCG